MTLFVELSLLLLLTTVVTVIVRALKQPLVVGYILSGIVAGPYLLNVLHSTHEIEVFSKVGIVLLLFIVGLHLNPKVIKEVGKVSVTTGLGQVIFTSSIGFFLALFLGLDRVAALYVAIALTFSSTIIILKLLSDKKDLHKLYAKIAMGLLLVQDIVATVVLIVIAVLAKKGEGDVTFLLLATLGKGAAIFVGLFLLGKYILPKLTRFVATSQELLFLFSLSWGTGVATLFLWAGFSVEIGALVAGVSLSTTPYADEMASRLKPLRDFFIVLFFILLGSQMVLADLLSILPTALALSLFVLIGNPVIVIILMNILGFSKRTGFLAGLTVAQISEFSLILATLGMQVGHLSQATLSLITLVGLITIAGSTYLILYGEKLYTKIAPVVAFLQLFKRPARDKDKDDEAYEAVLFGFDRVGHDFVTAFRKLRMPFFVVDFNPRSITRLESHNITGKYGDVTDPEFFEELPLNHIQMAVSTIPDVDTNIAVIRHLHHLHRKIIIVTIAHTIEHAQSLYAEGASYVVMPHHLGAKHAAELIQDLGVDHKGFEKKKKEHLSHLEKSLMSLF